MKELKIAINGVGGRMGHALCEAIAGQESLELTAAFEHSNSAYLGTDANAGDKGVEIKSSELIGEAGSQFDVLIDFSVPQSSVDAIQACAKIKRPVVVGTTGLSKEQQAAIVECAKTIPIVQAPNMSLGVNVCFALAQYAMKLLADNASSAGVEVDIIETHHHNKKDAPSGTALRLGDKVTMGFANKKLAGREQDTGTTTRDNIVYHSMRAGDVAGEHEVCLTLPGEQVQIRHKAVNRNNFALGALEAARWVSGQVPGLYEMNDVFGISSID